MAVQSTEYALIPSVAELRHSLCIKAGEGLGFQGLPECAAAPDTMLLLAKFLSIRPRRSRLFLELGTGRQKLRELQGEWKGTTETRAVFGVPGACSCPGYFQSVCSRRKRIPTSVKWVNPKP